MKEFSRILRFGRNTTFILETPSDWSNTNHPSYRPSPPFHSLLQTTFLLITMDSVIVHPKEITEEDQKRRAFMNNSSIHSYNHTTKKERIIRVTNARIFRNGKVGSCLEKSPVD